MTTQPEPLDTPTNWHLRIAARRAEVEALGLEAAMRLWHKRGESGAAVLSVLNVEPEAPR